jgi:putative heme iron utilization protein
MSTEKDSMLRVRLTQRQSDELDAIINELQAQMPEASVTASSIARRQVSKKKYIVRCPYCNHRVFDADYADVD